MQELNELASSLKKVPQLSKLLFKVVDEICPELIVVGSHRIIGAYSCENISLELIVNDLLECLKTDVHAENSCSTGEEEWVGAKNYVKWFPCLAKELAVDDFVNHVGCYNWISEIEDALGGGDENHDSLWIMRHLDNLAFERKLRAGLSLCKLALPVRDAIIS